ncbi:MAG: hypothetical protein Q4C66_06355 [Lachnospiraceae bacterium]|nr:hypothetical protein [Lachnospiraceae bacterium]
MKKDLTEKLAVIDANLDRIKEIWKREFTNQFVIVPMRLRSEWNAHFGAMNRIPGGRYGLAFKLPFLIRRPEENEKLIYSFVYPVLQEIQTYVLARIKGVEQKFTTPDKAYELLMDQVTSQAEELIGKDRCDRIFQAASLYEQNEKALWLSRHRGFICEPDEIWNQVRPAFLSSYRRWAFPVPTAYKISVALRSQIMKLLNVYQKNIQEHWYVYGMYLRVEYIRKEIHRAAEENEGVTVQ